MKTRDGREGAIIGVNRIGLELPGGSNSALDSAQSNYNELSGGPNPNEQDVKVAKERLDRVLKIREQFEIIAPEFLNSKSLEVTVPAEGLPDYKIDVSRK